MELEKAAQEIPQRYGIVTESELGYQAWYDALLNSACMMFSPDSCCRLPESPSKLLRSAFIHVLGNKMSSNASRLGNTFKKKTKRKNKAGILAWSRTYY